MKRWYVVHTHTRGERLAMVNLRRQGLDTYLPQYLKRRRHARRTEWIPAPLFPRYLFVAMDYSAVIEALKSNKLEIAFLGPASYVLAKDKVAAAEPRWRRRTSPAAP